MASTTPIVSQPQIGLLNNSHLRDINGGTYNNVAGDSHIYNSFVNSFTNRVSSRRITPILSQPFNV